DHGTHAHGRDRVGGSGGATPRELFRGRDDWLRGPRLIGVRRAYRLGRYLIHAPVGGRVGGRRHLPADVRLRRHVGGRPRVGCGLGGPAVRGLGGRRGGGVGLVGARVARPGRRRGVHRPRCRRDGADRAGGARPGRARGGGRFGVLRRLLRRE